MGGKIDFGLIREASRNEFVKLLNTVPGPKAIVWDKQLSGTFNLIGDVTFLRHHEVLKMYYISEEKLPSNTIANIIFCTRSTAEHMDLINHQLRMEGVQSGNCRKEFHLWCVPRITLLCEERLKQHGIYGDFASIQELPFYMYRLESDLATLELPSCFSDLYMNQDPSSLYHIARALMSVQGIFGLIPNVFGKGMASKTVFELMVGMRRELGGNEPQVPPQIDQLILIDRTVDLITPLATQLTYEGLIDQFFGINNCTVNLPADKFTPPRSDTSESPPSLDSGGGVASPTSANQLFGAETKTLQLTGSDPLYSDLRDFNFSAVGPRLSSEARSVSSQFESRRTASTVSDLKTFVQKLPMMQIARQNLSIQTAIAELVHSRIGRESFRPSLQAEQEMLKGESEGERNNAFIEERISQGEELGEVLRLICLQSVINCGLKPRVLDSYKREIINTYGFGHLVSLENLERAGLLTQQLGKSTYATVRKTLRLTVEDVNEAKPSDISYVHSGYAPLSVRLVEFLQCPGWRAITEVLNVLPGHTLSETQQLPSALRQRRGSGSSIQSAAGDPSTSLVVFIGGCTYAEVAALRFLSSKVDQGGPEYVILTTKMINSKSLLDSVLDPMTPQC